MNTLPGMAAPQQAAAEAEIEKGRPVAASKSLIPKAGHGIRTRDFDLGKFVVN
jgi:hypothetical protein